MPQTTQKTDLSALRIHRDGPSVTTTSRTTSSRSMKPIIWIIVAIVLLAILGYVASGLLSSPDPVEVGTVSMTSPSQANSVLTASGYVVASRKAAVGSKGTGRLVWLGVEEGSLVKKNQIIGRLEDADVEAALNQAQASLVAAQATLQSAQAGFA